MSFHVTIFGPKHYFWEDMPDIWFYRPDEFSSGGVGFKIPFLHVCFMWGQDHKAARAKLRGRTGRR